MPKGLFGRRFMAGRILGASSTMRPVSLVTSSSAPHLVLSGEIDLSVAPRLRDEGTEMAKSVAPGRLELDLGEVTFIDSSGLGALIALRNAAGDCGASLVVVRFEPGRRPVLRVGRGPGFVPRRMRTGRRRRS